MVVVVGSEVEKEGREDLRVMVVTERRMRVVRMRRERVVLLKVMGRMVAGGGSEGPCASV